MHVETMALWAKRAGLFATLLTIGITARFGWMQGEDIITSVCYAGGLALASFLVGYGLVFAWAAHKRRMGGLIVGACIAVFMIAVAVELLSHLGATASARTHDMARASEQTNAYADTRGELARARSELAALKATRPAAAIEAEMAALRNRVGWERTKQCSQVGGYPTLCRQYSALASDLAIAKQRADLDARIQRLTATSATTTSGHSVAAAQSSALAAYATLSIRPSDDDKVRTNMAIQLLLALYFVAIGLVNLIAHALEGDPAPAAAQPTATLHHIPPRHDRIEVLTKSLGEMARAQGKAA